MDFDQYTTSNWKVVMEQYIEGKWVYVGCCIFKKKMFIQILRYIKRMCNYLATTGEPDKLIEIFNFHIAHLFAIKVAPVRLTTFIEVTEKMSIEEFICSSKETPEEWSFIKYNIEERIIRIGIWKSVYDLLKIKENKMACPICVEQR